TGRRRQVTHLPIGPTPPPGARSTDRLTFISNHEIQFNSRAFGPDVQTYTVRTDGTHLTRIAPLPSVALSGFHAILPRLGITGPTGRDLTLIVPGAPKQQLPAYPNEITEAFRAGEDNRLVPLTTFGRPDTYGLGEYGRRRRSLVFGSGDPLGTNPLQNCQLFSFDILGGDPRQITKLDDGGQQSKNGCDFTAPPGCAFAEIFPDAPHDRLIFYSNCSPFGSNSQGSQIF